MYEFNEKSGVYLKNSDRIDPKKIIASGNHLGLRGEFRAMLRNANGSLAHDTGWNSNLIVDNAGYNYDSSFWYQYCCIGSSAAAPNVANTAIGTFMFGQSASTNPMPFTDYPRPPVAPNWERYSYRSWRFAAGEGVGNVNEFTIGVANNGTDIFCRHVLPATIVKGATQSLDIYYRFYIYPDITPRTGTVTIDGILYNWETSFYKLDTYNYTLFNRQDFNDTFASNFIVYNGNKGTPTLDPTGTSANTGVMSFVTQAQWSRTNRFTLGLNYCNVPSPYIRVITIPMETYHKVQIFIVKQSDLTTGVPKDLTKEMTIDWKFTWGRYP